MKTIIFLLLVSFSSVTFAVDMSNDGINAIFDRIDYGVSAPITNNYYIEAAPRPSVDAAEIIYRSVRQDELRRLREDHDRALLNMDDSY